MKKTVRVKKKVPLSVAAKMARDKAEGEKKAETRRTSTETEGVAEKKEVKPEVDVPAPVVEKPVVEVKKQEEKVAEKKTVAMVPKQEPVPAKEGSLPRTRKVTLVVFLLRPVSDCSLSQSVSQQVSWSASQQVCQSACLDFWVVVCFVDVFVYVSHWPFFCAGSLQIFFFFFFCWQSTLFFISFCAGSLPKFFFCAGSPIFYFFNFCAGSLLA